MDFRYSLEFTREFQHYEFPLYVDSSYDYFMTWKIWKYRFASLNNFIKYICNEETVSIDIYSGNFFKKFVVVTTLNEFGFFIRQKFIISEACRLYLFGHSHRYVYDNRSSNHYLSNYDGRYVVIENRYLGMKNFSGNHHKVNWSKHGF